MNAALALTRHAARVVWTACALALHGAPAAASPEALRFVTKQFPPYAYTDASGQAAGPMVEVLKAVCSRAAWQCHVEVLPWRRAYQRIEAGEADGIFPFVNTPERRQQYVMSPNVVQGRYVLMGKPGGPGREQGQPPSGRTIAAFGPSEASRTLASVVRQHPGTRAHIEADPGAVVRKLLAGRYGQDGLGLVNEAVARWQLAATPPGSLQTVEVVREFNYGFALLRRPGHETLAQQMTEAIQALCRSGAIRRRLEPYGLQAADCAPSAAAMPPPSRLPRRP